jgi:amino acid adenylation domain-containing protein
VKPIDVFLADLSRQNIQVQLDGEQMRISSKVALPTELVDQLRQRKPEILRFLRQHAKPEPPVLRRAARTDPLPLSHAQERLWFLDQLEGAGSAYTMPMALRLQGPLSIDAMERSLRELVYRHESLRTVFTSRDGQLAQVIGAPDFRLPRHDLTALPSEVRAKEARRLAAEDAESAIDLVHGPVFRATLLCLSEQEHVLLLNVHHIVSDGWSMGVLVRELATLYGAFQQGLPSPLPELPIQYADFAVWQRDWLAGQAMAEQLAYWKRQLADLPSASGLPLDWPRPVRPTWVGNSVHRQLAGPLSETLKALGRQHDTTLFATLLAALNLLLARLTGQEDVAVGTPSAGRHQVELEGLVGFFLNSLVLRTELVGNPTFSELLRRVSRVALEAFAHQDVSFEKLVAELQPARQPGQTPFFQVLFNMIPPQAELPNLAGLQVEAFKTPALERVKFDLTLYVQETRAGLDVRALYNAELFSAARIEQLLDQYLHLLEQISRNASRPLDAYSLVPPTARALLPDLAQKLPEPAYDPVHEQIAAWARRAPTGIAVLQGEERWTYQDLMLQADAVTAWLRDEGLHGGSVVALWGPRSFGLVAAMVGIWGGGGVVLPLDPGLPPARTEAMLAEARPCRLILVADDTDGSPGWLSDCGLAVLWLHPHRGWIDPAGPHEAPASELAAPEALAIAPDAPAYVVFTSGTTGIPKGVIGTHRGLAHFLRWQSQTFSIDVDDRAGQLTRLAFDVVLRDILVALVSGGGLVLPPSEEGMDGRLLIDWLVRERITLVHAVPSLAQAWLADIPPGTAYGGLRLAFFAGEPLLAPVVEQWRAVFPRCEIVNLYGPSETTLAKCFYRVPSTPAPGVQPLGWPLPETQALVLRDTRPCGVGELGEIAIRTPFRSLGYLNRPEEQRRFMRNPCTADANDLVYLTGDLGRYLPDGSLSFVGRSDDQVKIHGVRIEPRGIEAVLAQHPAVRQCAVIAFGEGVERRLVAYVVGHAGVRLSIAQLREHLHGQLPDAMIPAAFVVLEALPLTANGKTDHRALPLPSFAPSSEERLFPRTLQEHRLVRIWEEVLGVAPIGVRDSFFALGGHSLLAVRLMGKIRECFGQVVPLETLFQHPTVEALAQVLSQTHGEEWWSPLVGIQTHGDAPPLFCLPGMGSNVLYFHALAARLGIGQPVYALQTAGMDGITPPDTTVEAVVERYLPEIRRVRPHGPYQLAGHSWGGKIAFALAQALAKQGEGVSLLALFDSTPPGLNDPVGVVWDEATVVQEILLGLQTRHGLDFKEPCGQIAAATSDERIRLLRTCLEQANGLPPGTDLAPVRGMVNVFQTGLTMAHRPRNDVKIPITFFAARDTGEMLIRQKVTGWERLSPVTVEIVPGAHATLLDEPHVRVLAERLTTYLVAHKAEHL